jgi:hypothetical protein
MSHHNLLVRWRRVDRHSKFLFSFSRSRGQTNVFVVSMPSHAVANFHLLYPVAQIYFDLAVANLQTQFFALPWRDPSRPPPMLRSLHTHPPGRAQHRDITDC